MVDYRSKMNEGINQRLFFILFVLLFLSLEFTQCDINNDSRDANSSGTKTNQQVRWWQKNKFNKPITKQLNSIFGYNISPEAKMTSTEIISSRGYTVETHKVTTDDNYILEIHRIPYGKSQSSNSSIKRRPVFLQHGLLNTDAVWLILPSDHALAFVLADLGYDVWLGNIRGNTYSRAHTTLNPANQDYWKFSPDEMGKYDIPACINYVLSVNGASSLSYVGHSMGCAAFFIAMTYHTELNSKIDVMFALAPATANGNSQTIIRYEAPFVNQIVTFNRLIGATVYQPVDSLQHNWQKRNCGPNMFLRQTLCQNYVFQITSDSYNGLDLNLLPVIDGHFPAGTSIMTAAFFAQNYNARETFQAYDFGPGGNQARYGQSTPLVYDLSKVTCPVYIFWGPNDKAVAPKDVAWLAARLGNLKSSIQVQDSDWNHGAHLYSSKAKQLVYDQIIQLLPSTPY